MLIAIVKLNSAIKVRMTAHHVALEKYKEVLATFNFDCFFGLTTLRISKIGGFFWKITLRLTTTPKKSRTLLIQGLINMRLILQSQVMTMLLKILVIYVWMVKKSTLLPQR